MLRSAASCRIGGDARCIGSPEAAGTNHTQHLGQAGPAGKADQSRIQKWRRARAASERHQSRNRRKKADEIRGHSDVPAAQASVPKVTVGSIRSCECRGHGGWEIRIRRNSHVAHTACQGDDESRNLACALALPGVGPFCCSSPFSAGTTIANGAHLLRNISLHSELCSSP
jgi:hypothetical protein